MNVRNEHSRDFDVPPEELGALLDTLASDDDRLWPGVNWPKMRFDRPLQPGAIGGHGPIRYVVEEYEPGVSIRFRFTGPEGFDGAHWFFVEALSSGARVTHLLVMETSGRASLSWLLFYRPLHDALVEDALDRAAEAVGEPLVAPHWSLWVKLLRAIAGRKHRR